MAAGKSHSVKDPVSGDQADDAFARDRDTQVLAKRELPRRIGPLHPLPALKLFIGLEPVEMAPGKALIARENVLAPFIDSALIEQRGSDINRTIGRSGQAMENALLARQVAQGKYVAPFRIEDEEVGALARCSAVETAVRADGQRSHSALSGRNHVERRLAENAKIKAKLIGGVCRGFLSGDGKREREENGNEYKNCFLGLCHHHVSWNICEYIGQ